MAQEIIFTTLPHKRINKEGKEFLQLSVYATIKLNTPKDTTLAEFEDMLRFPRKILDANFQFKLGNGTLLDAELQKDLIDPELYENIFHRDIKVDDFKEEEGLSAKNIHSVPIKHINEYLLKS